jgi:hypothetical protein
MSAQPPGNLPPEISSLLRDTIKPRESGGFLTSVLGMDPNRADQFVSGLGAGFKAAGQNANKPLGAALGTFGSAIEGGQQAQNQQQDQRLKSINAAIHAWQIGDMAKYHQALADYHAALVGAKSAGSPAAPTPPAPAAPIWPAPTNVYGPPAAPPAAPAPAPAATAAPPRITDKAAYDRLAPGASYIAPDGSFRTKQ